MTFNLFVRRLHLYLALSLSPWFFLYGISSFPFAHRTWLDALYADGTPDWKVRFERNYDLPVASDTNLREIGAQIIKDAGLEGSFGISRPNERRINMYVHTFWTASQVTYFLDQKRLRVEDRRFRWDSFLTGMHARGGFEDRSPLSIAWSVVVDLVCIGFLLWIATGIYMWWKLPQTRFWGFMTLGAGSVLFLIFLVAL